VESGIHNDRPEIAKGRHKLGRSNSDRQATRVKYKGRQTIQLFFVDLRESRTQGWGSARVT
jgi:hypothetical protein